MTTPILPDDRRHLTTRLTVLQWIVAGAFASLAVGFWVFQVAQHEKFEVMAENNHSRRLQLPAPRGVLFDRNLQGPGREPEHLQHHARPRAGQGQPRATRCTCSPTSTGADAAVLKETVNRKRREPSYRPIVLIENATLEQVSRSRLRHYELLGHRLSGSAGAQVSVERPGGAPVRLRQRGQRGAAGAQPITAASSRARMVGQAGVEQAYNKLLMGTDGDRFVVVNSLRPRDARDAR